MRSLKKPEKKSAAQSANEHMMKSLVDYVERPEIRIGEYSIQENEDGSFWFRHESGEGMRISAEELEEEVADLYKRLF